MDTHLQAGLRPGSDEAASRLTQRQLECLAWAREGKSAADIGQILGISGRTVEGHFAKVCEVLGVRTRVQAVVRALELGWLAPTGGQVRTASPPRTWPRGGR